MSLLSFARGGRIRLRLSGPFGLIVILSTWLPGELAGQSAGATLRGSVVDTVSGAPVGRALLRFDTGRDVRAGPDGRFVVTGLEVGTRGVAIVTPGCGVSVASVQVSEGGPTEVVFRVGVEETGPPETPPSPLPGSRIVSSGEIEEMHVGSMVELLRRVAPKLIQSVSGQPGTLPRITSRGVASAQGPVSPILVLDGVNLGSLESPGALDAIHPADIAFMELFDGAIGGWSYGTGGSGGVIRVTTKRGGSVAAPGSDLTKCPIPGWR